MGSCSQASSLVPRTEAREVLVGREKWRGREREKGFAGRERRRDKHPPFAFFRSSSQGRHGQGWHRVDMGQRSSFPYFCVVPAGSWGLLHFHK